MLQALTLRKAVLDVRRAALPIVTTCRNYNKEYEHAQLKVDIPMLPEQKEGVKTKFKDHRRRLAVEFRENKNQGCDPLLERIKAEEKGDHPLVESSSLEDVSKISGVPEDQIKKREVRIFSPARNAMQSGSFATHKWRIQWDNQERWENPLMGWTSSADPLSGLHVEFTSPEDAIAYCKRMGYSYTVQERQQPKMKPKSYAANFAWNRNTRISSK